MHSSVLPLCHTTSVYVPVLLTAIQSMLRTATAWRGHLPTRGTHRGWSAALLTPLISSKAASHTRVGLRATRWPMACANSNTAAEQKHVALRQLSTLFSQPSCLELSAGQVGSPNENCGKRCRRWQKTNSVKALKKIQSADCNRRKPPSGFIPYNLSNDSQEMEWISLTLSLRHLSDAGTKSSPIRD